MNQDVKNDDGEIIHRHDVSQLDHIGIAVANLEEAVHVFHDVLGLSVTHRERLENYGIDMVSV